MPDEASAGSQIDCTSLSGMMCETPSANINPSPVL